MIGFLLGRKNRQTQGYNERKMRQVLTELSVGPCYVTGLRTKDQDGYWAIQIATLTKKAKNVKKPVLGQAKKAGITDPLNFFKEVYIKESLHPSVENTDGKSALKVGDKTYTVGMRLMPSEVFNKDDVVEVTGVSKGKGFQGVVKRHGFKGGPKTHGQSDRERAPGSIGSGTTPGRVWKGKRMAGRMGQDTITVKGLRVVETAEDKLVLKGLVPGSVNSVLLVKTNNG